MSEQNGTDRDWQREAAAWRARAEHLQATVDRLRSLAVAGESAGFLAHELNNLFTPVVGYCHAAQVAGADEVIKRKAMEKSLAAAERVGDLASAILRLAGTAGADAAVGGESDVGEAVRSALMVLGAERWGREGVEVVTSVPRGTFVNASAGVVQQVVMNLVLNARRAMVGRAGVIEVTGCEVRGVVRMEVRDGGGGMSAEVMGRVFGINGNDEQVHGDQGARAEVRGGADRFEVDVQELARSGSINGQARWGVRVKAESEKRKAKTSVGAKVDRLRGAKIGASASPIRVWDAEEVAAELRSGDARREMRDVSGEGLMPNSKWQMANGKSESETGRSAGLSCETRDVSRGGTGLGLALCLELVGRVGGRMWAESTVGEGTVVSVEWPRAELPSARVAA